MSEPICVRCARPLADGAYVCDRCASQAAQKLAEIAEVAPASRDIANGLSRRSQAGGSGKPGPRLPLDLGAMARLMAVQGELTTWARHVAEERGMPAWDGSESPDYLIRAAQYLAAHLEWMRHRPEADEFMTDVDACARVLRGLARGPADLQFLGLCGALVAWDDDGNETSLGEPCPGHVFGGTKSGTCRACGARWDNVGERLFQVKAAVRDGLYHTSEIAEAYPIRAETIRVWLTRGLLIAHGEHQGRPLLKLGEVLDLAAGDAARREEARAARARRMAAKASGEEAA